jgi:hypothetical protein
MRFPNSFLALCASAARCLGWDAASQSLQQLFFRNTVDHGVGKLIVGTEHIHRTGAWKRGSSLWLWLVNFNVRLQGVNEIFL